MVVLDVLEYLQPIAPIVENLNVLLLKVITSSHQLELIVIGYQALVLEACSSWLL
jgi:hypothetical protein